MLRHSFHTLNRISLAILTISLGIGIDGIPVALAQGASLEEIIVTARKRDENLMDIPESVSAIGAAEVERRNIKGLNKIGLAVPNLNLSMRTDGYPNITIRGVGAYGMTLSSNYNVRPKPIELIIKGSKIKIIKKRQKHKELI